MAIFSTICNLTLLKSVFILKCHKRDSWLQEYSMKTGPWCNYNFQELVFCIDFSFSMRVFGDYCLFGLANPFESNHAEGMGQPLPMASG